MKMIFVMAAPVALTQLRDNRGGSSGAQASATFPSPIARRGRSILKDHVMQPGNKMMPRTATVVAAAIVACMALGSSPALSQEVVVVDVNAVAEGFRVSRLL